MGIFQICANHLYWLDGAPDAPNDLCLHGDVTICIGQSTLKASGTVSATALYLLKTLEEDKFMAPYDIQMVPCCGHSLFANSDLTSVTISGCDKGTDWSTIHEGAFVRLILPSGLEERIPLSDYQNEVFRFADKIEAFYQTCAPKILPANEIDRNGYIAFWNEWHRRRTQNA